MKLDVEESLQPLVNIYINIYIFRLQPLLSMNSVLSWDLCAAVGTVMIDDDDGESFVSAVQLKSAI